jgi:hypothetical protein
MSTMKAAVLESYGTALHVTDVLRPQPGRGEVLIRISASGINPLDTKIFAAQRPTPVMLRLRSSGWTWRVLSKPLVPAWRGIAKATRFMG